jgi:hypothetical protein
MQGHRREGNMVESDIWNAAQSMIDLHGEHAEQQANLKLEQLFEKNDPAGVAAWKKIITAIIVLRVAAPGLTQVDQ